MAPRGIKTTLSIAALSKQEQSQIRKNKLAARLFALSDNNFNAGKEKKALEYYFCACVVCQTAVLIKQCKPSKVN